MIHFFFSFFLLFFCGLNAAVFAGFTGSLRKHSRYARSTGQCKTFVEGPFRFCSAAGYNETFQFPPGLTKGKMEYVANKLQSRIYRGLDGCANESLAWAMACSLMVPQCSKGQRVLPCKRVCSEYLKKCEKRLPNFILEYSIPLCHVLPDKKASSGKCHEPPNFRTNDSIKGPLDRNCSKLIFPACKTLGVSNFTLVSEDHQKKFYTFAYDKEYKEGKLETNFPPRLLNSLKKYPKCQKNIKRLFCGEFMPPCFADEFALKGHGYYTICQSVCDQITKDCPGFFRNDFPDAEYCSTSGKETTSHGFCRRSGWPSPFLWARYIEAPTVTPSVPATTPEPTAVKGGIIAVAVVVTFLLVAVGIGGAIWWKWWRVPGQSAYKRQEDDVAPLEQNIEI